MKQRDTGTSHLFAYLARMKFIRRWGLMHNNYPENIQEHSLQVALVAHALAVIRNRLFGGDLDPARVATLALFHDVGEVLIGDLPSPVKYFNPEIRSAYGAIETTASRKLLGMVPEPLRADYAELLLRGDDETDRPLHELVQAADKVAAYLKCVEEVSAGNREFTAAETALRRTVDAIELPEVRYFLDTFAPSFRLPLDALR